MAETTWTASQRAAIETVGRSVLVSAGAGSGKTAVLAERCAHLVADVRPPTPVDGLLVVTFTDAAASEMRLRIEKALRDRLERRPTDRWLRQQLALLDTATISTIHSFCRRVLNRYFAQADLDPQAPVLDAQDAELLRQETAQGVFERWGDRRDATGEAFLDLLSAYGGGSEERLIEAVLKVDQFLTSVPDPELWTKTCLERIGEGDAVPAFWLERLGETLRGELDVQSRTLASNLASTREVKHEFAARFAVCFEEYAAALDAWRARLGNANASAVESVCAAIGAHDFGKIPPRSKKIQELGDDAVAAFERLKEQAEAARDTFFKDRLLRRYGGFQAASAAEGLARTQRPLKTLLRLVEAVRKEYESAKHELGAVDFADLERLTLRLLRDEESGAARRLRDQYRFVLLDEFQDVNPVQAEILRRVSREDDPTRAANLFAVGDVRQSIYRFRLAEPRLFLQRCDAFAVFTAGGGCATKEHGQEPQSRGVRIDLRENFRSRPGVIDAVNAVFERLIAPDLGGIAYDEQARLVAMREPKQRGPACELHLLEKAPRGGAENEDDAEQSSAMDWEQIEREAHVIARRIHELAREGWAYRDIVILLRSMKPRAGLFVRTLARQGVPVFADMAGGIFEALEVMDVLALLDLLDNEQQDIPLAAILRGPLLGRPLSDDELVEIRTAARSVDVMMPFHAAVRHYSLHGPGEDLRTRLRSVFECLDRWRQRIRRRPLADVLWEIYEESGILAYVGGLREGMQRRANLLRLHDYARQFGAFNRQGLFRFLRFVEALAESEQDLEPGSVASQAADVVRVMTIHRSKGLEFPVVILGELGKRFNLNDARGSIVFDRQLGVALEAVDLEKRIVYPTLPSRLVAQAVKNESLAEELRVLYVALTRARERLVLVGSGGVKQLDAARQRLRGHVGPLDLLDRQTATSMLDWVLDAVCCQPDERVAFPNRDRQRADTANQAASDAALFAVRTYAAQDMQDWSLDPPVSNESAAKLEQLARMAPLAVGAPTADPNRDRERADIEARSAVERVARRLTTPYPALALTRVPSVVAASKLKRRWDATQDAEEPTKELSRGLVVSKIKPPSFLAAAQEIDPTQRGVWTHEFLQRVDLRRPCDVADLKSQLKQTVAEGWLTAEEARHIDVSAVAWFFTGELGKRLRGDGVRVLREWPFVMGVEPSRYDPAAMALDAGDVMLVRGIIDCLFDAGGGWEIIDYKTDAVSGDGLAARAQAYRGQVAIYSSAVEVAWKKPVAATWLVFLSPRRIVKL